MLLFLVIVHLIIFNNLDNKAILGNSTGATLQHEARGHLVVFLQYELKGVRAIFEGRSEFTQNNLQMTFILYIRLLYSENLMGQVDLIRA